MTNFDETTGEHRKQRNPNCLKITDHPYRILVIGLFGSGKTDTLLNLNNFNLT